MRVLMLKEALPAGGAERQLALIMKHLPPTGSGGCGPWAAGRSPTVDRRRRPARRCVARARPASTCARPRRCGACCPGLAPRRRASLGLDVDAAALPLCRRSASPSSMRPSATASSGRKGSLQRRLSQAVSALVVANSQAGLDAWGVGRARAGWSTTPSIPSASRRRSERRAGAGDGAPCPWSWPGAWCPQGLLARCWPRRAAGGRERRRRPGWRFLLLGDGPDEPPSRRRGGQSSRARRRAVRRPRPRGAAARARGRHRRAHVERGPARRGLLERHHGVHELRACRSLQRRRRQSGTGARGRDRLSRGVRRRRPPWPTALAALAERPETARRLGDAGRRRILEEFSVPRLVRGIERVYWKALS